MLIINNNDYIVVIKLTFMILFEYDFVPLYDYLWVQHADIHASMALYNIYIISKQIYRKSAED